MVKKAYAWDQGATLDEHSRRKHKILREYFYQYIVVRCQNPQQTKFRLAVVNGFSGGGRYACGAAGSPIIFIEELQRALEAVNLRRISQGLGKVEIECLLIFNDSMPGVTQMLQEFCDPLVGAAKVTCPDLHLDIAYSNKEFEEAYPVIKGIIAGRFRNVIWNLDQCGHVQVDVATINEIMRSTPSVEIFYTFAIDSLLTFLSRTNPGLMAKQVRHLDINPADLRAIDGIVSNESWLGAAERIVFEAFHSCASYVSPFSITNPKGWRYWLIHFANNYRARQVYNDVLHDNGTQAHFGLPGLHMLHYDPEKEGGLYLFEAEHRAKAKLKLIDDIPRFVSESGDAMLVGDFYAAAYSATPAHKDDIHGAMLGSDDLEVRTPAGGVRRMSHQITVRDTLRLKNQRSFFTYFDKLT
ncbi:three-Cys-motif partner protein TcmP [Sphingomonas sp.]|uniref:three-Cys-motif partner protein TcmP n=1 Tax=Sphingomonas sp. TaxID=28214 RepID=UPI003D6D2C86